MRLALVHDHLNQWGGAERVLKALHEVYPTAPIFTVVADPKLVKKYLPDADIRTSRLQHKPLAVRKLRWYLPFIPSAVEQFDLRGFDVVLSSSSAYAKGIITQPETTHICYCHTPTRYLWNDTNVYREDLPVGRAIKRVLPLYLKRMRLWDRLAADRVDHFVANSKHIAARIQKYYSRDSAVIYPPVDVDHFKTVTSPKERGNYFVTVGRLRPYKRIDIVVQAFNELGHSLKVVGVGDDARRLKRLARGNIEFVGFVSEEEKAHLLAHAQAFLHPQEEDFGIAAVEAMAAGTPVIAYGHGGAKETVVPGVTGELFPEQTAASLIEAVRHFNSKHYQAEDVRNHVAQFARERFQDEIRDFVWQRYQSSLTL